ncbi:FtsH protease activity modulator HflK [Legionella clemsonensis]|uniref:Protein HflK n=1 Tax=Legionella clemsonensis TaxID=1867846 RepID=A0A222P517_9GAMM|nr:FtsH protease activity modulator HflK [Legionella clemsonensis]ASQ46941.1 Modulator of FtsH protease HflK [Legionella clemsonensis]
MGWNEPDKGKDPWSGKNQPPDLDEALKRFQEKLKKTFFGGSNQPDGNSPANKGSGGLLALMAALIVFILWALAGIFIVDPAEQAVILRFGKYVETVGPGPHWIPRIISTKVVQNVDRVSDYSYSAQMLTKDENLVAVSVVVQYRIGDLEEYLFNVADPQESLQQATSSALRQVVGTTTFDQIITEGREAWGNSVQDTLVKILNQYKTGIVIVNVSPQPARAPENVQDAFDDAIKAREDEKRFREQALAYQAKVVPIAEGNAKRIFEEAQAYAQQVILRAKGDVAEFLALLPEYTQAPVVTSERMYLEMMQQVLSKSSKIIVDGKSGNLLYLPLDKLANASLNPPLMNTESADAKKAAEDEQVESAIVTTRNLGRRTYRQGRDD